MIVVFNKFPVYLGMVGPTFSVINGRAATAAAELTNVVEWIVTQD